MGSVLRRAPLEGEDVVYEVCLEFLWGLIFIKASVMYYFVFCILNQELLVL